MARMNKSGPLRAARSSSREKQPGVVTFAEAGDHKMRLRVKHAVEEKVSEQLIRVDSALFFFVEPHQSGNRMPPFFSSAVYHNLIICYKGLNFSSLKPVSGVNLTFYPKIVVQ